MLHLIHQASQVELVVKYLPASAGDARDMGSVPGLGRSPRRKWQPTPIFLPGKSHGQEEPGGLWSRTCKETDVTEWLSTHILCISWRNWGMKKLNKVSRITQPRPNLAVRFQSVLAPITSHSISYNVGTESTAINETFRICVLIFLHVLLCIEKWWEICIKLNRDRDIYREGFYLWAVGI